MCTTFRKEISCELIQVESVTMFEIEVDPAYFNTRIPIPITGNIPCYSFSFHRLAEILKNKVFNFNIFNPATTSFLFKPITSLVDRIFIALLITLLKNLKNVTFCLQISTYETTPSLTRASFAKIFFCHIKFSTY